MAMGLRIFVRSMLDLIYVEQNEINLHHFDDHDGDDNYDDHGPCVLCQT